MENISLKLEKEFLKTIEAIMKKHNYMTKTEFIREAIRDKIKELEKIGKTRPGVTELEEKDKEQMKHASSFTHISERKEIPSYI
jgi:metal-responsive CopG/Arc/MetJ family transcriptional regulator